MKYALPLTVLLALAAGLGCTADGRGLPPFDASTAGTGGGAGSGGDASASGGESGAGDVSSSGGRSGDVGMPAVDAGMRLDETPGSGGMSGADAAAVREDAPGSGDTPGTDAAERWDEAPDGVGRTGTDAAVRSDDASDSGGLFSVDVVASWDEAINDGSATAIDAATGSDDGLDSGGTSGADAAVGPDGSADSSEAPSHDAALALKDGAGPDGSSAVDAGVDSGTSWRLVWSDEFSLAANSGADTTKWTPATSDPGAVNGEKQKYTARPQNIFHDGQGHLVLRGRHDFWNSNGTTYPYTSGRLQTDGKFQLKFGRVEVSAKLPAGQGSFPAILLVGTAGNWPQCGEIGIMEQWGQDKSWLYCSTYAGGASGDIGSKKITFPNATTLSSDFHLYALEWYSDHMVFLIDDVQVARSDFDGTSPFYTGTFYMILDVAIGGAMGGTIDDAGGFPMDMVLDYVRVYAQQ